MTATSAAIPVAASAWWLAGWLGWLERCDAVAPEGSVSHGRPTGGPAGPSCPW